MLTSRLPYPLERGDKLRIFHQIVELSKSHEVHLFALTSEPIKEKSLNVLQKYCTSVNVYKQSIFKQASNLIRNISSDLPFQTGMLYDTSIKAKIGNRINDLKIDLVYCQLVRMAPYAIDITLPKVIDFMDAFGIGMLRRAKLSSWPTKWFYQIESKRVLRYEESVSELFNERIIISEQDKAIINTQLTIHVITNGIDTQYFYPRPSKIIFDIVYVGNMGYLPNVEASEILVNKVAKVYKKKFKQDLKILIAGARPSSRVLSLKSTTVSVKGWYDDIREAYASGKIMVAPLYHGTGQQNKILEAMAMGLPCVTTKDVNSAIHANEGIEILAVDCIDQMADHINKLLTNINLYDNMKMAGIKFVNEKYSWRGTVDQLNTIFYSAKNKQTKQ